jgi:hypothetical protein
VMRKIKPVNVHEERCTQQALCVNSGGMFPATQSGGPCQSFQRFLRSVVDVIFSCTNRNTDVTEEFPFLITKMTPYYDR